MEPATLPIKVTINRCNSPSMSFYGFENVARAGQLEETTDQVLLLLE